MQFFKHLLLFMKQNGVQLQRKWLSLPLILLFPIGIILMISFIIASFFTSNETEPIKVGLVDLDNAKETKMVTSLIEESSQLSNFIQLIKMPESNAIKKIHDDELSAYIVFPEAFVNDLYRGKSIEIPIVGNQNQPTKSLLVKELLDSVARHIGASQANILTINHYAKEMGIDSATRNDMLFEQFKEFLFYTIGKDRVLSEDKITNQATAAPLQYYSIASWFSVITIWLLSIFNFLYREDIQLIKQRLNLYGVTGIQEVLARMMTTLVMVVFLAVLSFSFLNQLLKLNLLIGDFVRIGLLTLLYSIVFLEVLAFIESMIHSGKLRLLVQTCVTGIVIILSGAIIPTIYFPEAIQQTTAFLFSTEVFHQLQELILNEQLYSNYLPLIGSCFIGIILLVATVSWKELRSR